MSGTPIVTGYEKATKGGIQVVERRSLMEQIREEASRRVIAREGYRGIMQFMDALAEIGLVVWLEYFPQICEEMRQVNAEKWRILNEIGNRGKFTESVGWSEGGTFKFEYEYTPEFFWFMKNYVYKDFFGQDNKRICRAFMKKILRGDNPIETLMRVKAIYGSNQQQEAVVVGGENGSNA